jgi:high frequency lysogenization protein
MNENRVLALAGVFQGCVLAHQLATKGSCDEQALENSLASVFRIDADSVAAVFGGISGVRVGLRSLVEQTGDNGERELAVARMAVTVLRLERTFSGRRRLVEQVHKGIVDTQRQADHFGLTHATVTARLAELYTSTLSTLRPRVLVNGSPLILQQQGVVERVRSALLAAVRAAVLWHQVGGRQWHLLLKRRQCAMLARGLLTGATLDNG